MKKFRQLFGLLLCISLVLFLFYGIKKLETSETVKIEDDKLERSFHQNPDVYAWLNVAGTRIEYPVAQHPSDDSYYLSHDLEHNETYYGAIFTEKVNSKSFDDPVTIIYGHAMVDDSMFGSLDYFADQQFFTDHSLITIDTVKNRYVYEILSAHPYTDDHLFHFFQLGSRSGLKQYLDTLQERVQTYGGFYRQVSLNGDQDKILILSTCDAANDAYRYVVTAKLKIVKER